MMEKPLVPPERPMTPEKPSEDLYLDILKLKRDVLSSHYAMNFLRKNIDSRIDEIPGDKFSEDEEVKQYESVREEYNKRRRLFLDSFSELPDEISEKVSKLTSLTSVEVAISTLEKIEIPVETAVEIPDIKTPVEITGEIKKDEIPDKKITEKSESALTLADVEDKIERLKKSKPTPLLELAVWEFKKAELEEREKAEADGRRREDIERKIKEDERLLSEKHKTFRAGADVIDGGASKEEIKKIEEEKTGLEKKLESPEGKVGKTWGDRIRSVFGKRKTEVAGTAEKEKTELKPEGSRQWTVLGWLAERGKGILSAGIWEVRQAWRFQRGTKFAANDLEALSPLIHVENADEAQEKANEILNIMKESGITTVTAPEFIDIAKKVTYEKAAENNDRIEYIIKNAIETLKEQVVKYRGQATTETVLTPENLKAVEYELRLQLNQFRDGATMKDVKNFARVMRDNMDKRWWLRYIYGPLELSLLGFLGYSYLPWSRWLGGGDLIPGGEDIALSPEETAQRYMDHNMWEESREDLKELGIDNPTHEEIQAVDSAAAQENNIRVVDQDTDQTLWPETTGGKTRDISMMKGLIKWGAAHKAALAIKAARIAAGLF